MPRRLNDFISAFQEYTKNQEPPESYHIWTCLGVLAGALQRKVYIKWGRATLYPNLYIILVGPAGRTRKGTALEFGRILLDGAGVKTVEGAITREKLIRRLAGSTLNIVDGTTGEMRYQCALTCLSEEATVFLGTQNVKFLADLCNWYDSPKLWTYDTKNQGTDVITGIYFNLLAATAPEWILSILPREAIGGGFTRRVFWIVEEQKRATIVHPWVDEDLERELIAELEHINLLSGEMKFDEEADNAYAEWYTTEDQKIASGNPPIHDPRFAGYCDTRATLVKKLSMLVSVSEGSNLVISRAQFKRAIGLMEAVEKKMPRAFANVGEAKYVFATNQIVSFLENRGPSTRSNLLRHFYKDIDGEAFEIIMETLRRMRLIKDHRLQSGDMLYELVPAHELLEEAKQHGEEKPQHEETYRTPEGHGSTDQNQHDDHGRPRELTDSGAGKAN